MQIKEILPNLSLEMLTILGLMINGLLIMLRRLKTLEILIVLKRSMRNCLLLSLFLKILQTEGEKSLIRKDIFRMLP